MSKLLKEKYKMGLQNLAPEEKFEEKIIVRRRVSNVTSFNMTSQASRYSNPDDLFKDVKLVIAGGKTAQLDFSGLDAVPSMDYFQTSIGRLVSENHISIHQLRGKVQFKFSERCSDKLERIVRMLHECEKQRIPLQRKMEINMHLLETTKGGKVVLSEH